VRTKQRKVDVGGPPRVVVVAPRVGPRLDRCESVVSIRAGKATADTSEVRINWRRMLVALMNVAPGGVRLPHFDELPGHGPSIPVEHSTGHNDPLTERLPIVLDREVRLEWVNILRSEDRRYKLNRFRVGVVQVFCWVTQETAAVGQIVET